MKKDCKKLVKKNSEQKKYLKVKRKGDKLYVKWKGSIIHLIIGLMRKTLNEIVSNAISFHKNESILS